MSETAQITNEEGARIMAEVAAHPRREVIEQIAEAMYDLANEDEDGPGGGMWYWLSYAYAVVEAVPQLFLAEEEAPDDGEPTSADTQLPVWDLR